MILCSFRSFSSGTGGGTCVTCLYIDGKLPAQRITTSLPPALVGTWEIPEYATMTIETTGAFEWVATETEGVMEQSGSGQSIGTYNGDNFLLSNITYDDYEEGENDYYQKRQGNAYYFQKHAR